MRAKIEIRYEGEYTDGRYVVYADDEPVRSFDVMSDDYASMNAREYAEKLERQAEAAEQIAEALVEKSADYYQNLYLEWVNDYLTVNKFAEDKSLSIDQALKNINIGRKIHEQRVLGERS